MRPQAQTHQHFTVDKRKHDKARASNHLRLKENYRNSTGTLHCQPAPRASKLQQKGQAVELGQNKKAVEGSVEKGKKQFYRLSIALWAGIVVFGLLGATAARAQFICGGSLDGATGLNGAGAAAAGSNGNVACGTSANASGGGFGGTSNTAIGAGANASGNSSVIGTAANTAIGNNANGSGNGSANVATGVDSVASGANSENVATGNGATGLGDGSTNTATGRAANASGNASSNIATGAFARAQGDNSFNTATGRLSKASGNSSSNVAIGDHADAHGDAAQNTAVGANSVATGNNSAAFGAGAQAPFINSAAFGAGAVATRPNQQVFGTSSNTYTLPGLTSPASAAAQSGPTQFVTTDAAGNLATTSFSTTGLASASDLARLDQKVGKAYTGTAMAFAMSASPTLLPGKKFALSANWGTFQGQNGTALSGAVRLYKDVQLNAAFAYGFRENMAGGRAGVGFQW
jgi:hypothetical protein